MGQNNLDLENSKIRTQLAYYLAGFSDAEGSFNVSLIRQENNIRVPWKIRPIFSVRQKDSDILSYLPKILGCGNEPYIGSDEIATFSVTNLTALRKHVIPFFEKFTFQTLKKQQDLVNFKEILRILEKPENLLTHSDIKQILALRVNSEAIVGKRTYKDEEVLALWQDPEIFTKSAEEIQNSSETTMPKSRKVKPTLNDKIESDLYSDIKAQEDLFCEIDSNDALCFFIAGFTDGDGSFNASFRINHSPESIGWKISGSFSIAQKDEPLLKRFQRVFNCGNIRPGSSHEIFYFEVNDQNVLRTLIVPFFRKYPILSNKNGSRFENLVNTLEILSKGYKSMTRIDLEEILKLQRGTLSTRARYTPEQILMRFDLFTKNKKRS